ncbi:MAG: CpeR family transcriptional regulator [Gomphosphaeria aponina SAG 52.96 = DSM 107014]|uniref:CpeR family transcriptional regulator n=1 Tax=Gomphosphaeria aponina SAG 52.96 = DSM 107014 TaxID=1521640 RepID=A0A941GMB3_9CHRO|nr:CpeR family transcriptional regulator [Gomphosphaeria aponina SAG 52.96 = DSM 107014]
MSLLAALKKMQSWIRSKHLIYAGDFLILETLKYPTVERFEECISTLGGTLLGVATVKKVSLDNQRIVILYRAKATFSTPHNQLKEYWFNYGSFSTRFEQE